MGIYGPSVTPKSAGETVTPVTAATTSASVIAANTARAAGSYIVNYASKIMYVSWGSTTAVASNAFTPVPANGGAIDFPNDHVGAVQAIWATGATGSAYIHEFTGQ